MWRVRYKIGTFGKFKDFDKESVADQFVTYLKNHWQIVGEKEKLEPMPMYDWTDDFRIQARQSFPTLANYIDQCIDQGDTEPMMNLLLNLVVKEGVCA